MSNLFLPQHLIQVSAHEGVKPSFSWNFKNFVAKRYQLFNHFGSLCAALKSPNIFDNLENANRFTQFLVVTGEKMGVAMIAIGVSTSDRNS